MQFVCSEEDVVPAPSPLSFDFKSPPFDIIAGRDSISEIADSLENFGLNRAMIICGPSILGGSNVIERVRSALGDYYVGIFSNVGPHVPAETMAEAAGLASDLEPDVLVSVGGGSTHDTSKALALLIAEGGDIHDYDVSAGAPPSTDRPRLPIVAVPTTIGCAELSAGGGGTVTDKALGRKFAFPGSGSPARVVILDGEALATTPMRVQLSTAFSALRIGVECVCALSHNPIGDALALHGIRMLIDYLPRCSTGDPDVLLNAKLAATLPSLARLAVGGPAISTAICHQAGGLYDIPHGEVHAIMLPHSMRFNLDHTADRQALIAEAMGLNISEVSAEEAGSYAADVMAGLARELGLPTSLREVGVPEEGLEVIASATFQYERGIALNPKPITNAAVLLRVLREAW